MKRTSIPILSCASALVALLAPQQAAAQTRSFNVPAGLASKAIPEFARQAGIQIVAPVSQLHGVRTRAIRGSQDVRTALAQLLADTQLEIVSDTGTMIVLRSRSGPSAETTAIAADGMPPAQEIVVTGSRLIQNPADAVAAVQTVPSETAVRLGYTSLNDVLQQSAALGVGLNAAATWRNGDAGASFANLRGLGVNRTLVLVNGHRRVSGSNLTSAVDLNIIPIDMIDRVEIITGGASAIYGADAVSGVINVITRRNGKGIELSARGGISDKRDAGEWSLGAFGGTTFDEGRGSIQLGATYSRQDGFLTSDRSFADKNLRYQPNPQNTGPGDGIPDNITIDARFPYINRDVNFYINNRLYAASTAGIRLVDLGRVISPGSRPVTDGGEGSTSLDDLMLRMPVETLATRADMAYDISDSLTVSLQGEFAKTWSYYNDDFSRYDERTVWLSGRGGPKIQLDNQYLPTALRDLMRANGLTEAVARKQSRDELGYRRSYHDRTTFTINTALDGMIAGGWKWGAFFQYGEYVDDIRNTNRLIASHYINAVDVIADPAGGAPICRSAAARAGGCVPYNIFDRKPFTEAQRAYLVHTRLQYAKNSQMLYGGQMSGNLFPLPAGDVRIALGIEGRRETLTTRDDYYTLSGEGDHADTQARLPIDASYRVFEGFGEIKIPLFADKPWLKHLDLDGAVRVARYNTIGTTVAYRGGINWAVDDDLRLRVSQARSVRAPNLLELYSPAIVSSPFIVSPCDATRVSANANRIANCRAFGFPANFTDSRAGTLFVASGNKDLSEETSYSFTAGASLTPSWLHGLRLSVDYWTIKIKDAVSSFTGNDIADRCFDAASLNNSFCGRLTFAKDLNILKIDTSSLNVGRSTAAGLDVGAGFELPIRNGDRLDLDFQGTWLISREELVTTTDPTSLFIRDGRYTDPRFRGNLTLRYQHGDWSGSAGLRFISAAMLDPQASAEKYDRSRVSARAYSDLTVNGKLTGTVSLVVGVRNLFDVAPPANPWTFLGGSTTESAGAAVYYDTVGRFLHAALKATF